MVAVSAGHEYLCGTRGSGIVSNASVSRDYLCMWQV